MGIHRWDNCVAHHDDRVLDFFKKYFRNTKKICLLIGGAGFDPRSAKLVSKLSDILGERLIVHLIREQRPDPDSELVKRAESNLEQIKEYCKNLSVQDVEIFANDGAVVGGRNVIREIEKIAYDEFTDVVIDLSALSMGISYPIVKYVFEFATSLSVLVNIHLAVLSNPDLDSLIQSEPDEHASDIHGFRRAELFGESERARLWLPLLAEEKEAVTRLIHNTIRPHDTCPILPFPSEDPKKADRIAYSLFSSIQSDWGGPLENEWGLDPRNFVYADERKPLDIYRTILRIDEERKPVFTALGGSIVVLSPLGSKIPAIGGLLAAMERDFPVVYVEALGYTVDWNQIDADDCSDSRMVHIWLYGDAYLKDIEAKSNNG